jgi:hypothetical protein
MPKIAIKPFEIIGQDVEADLRSGVFQRLHEEVRRSHPAFRRAERMAFPFGRCPERMAGLSDAWLFDNQGAMALHRFNPIVDGQHKAALTPIY